MNGPWLAGLQIRGLDRDQTPTVDLLCTNCWHHKRVTGRAKVTDYLRSNPIHDHRVNCPAQQAP